MTAAKPKSAEEDAVLAMRCWLRRDKRAVADIIDTTDDPRGLALAAMAIAATLLGSRQDADAYLDAVEQAWEEEKSKPEPASSLPASDTAKARVFLRYKLDDGQWHRYSDLLDDAMSDKGQKMWAWNRSEREVLGKTLTNAAQALKQHLERRGGGPTVEWRLRKASR